MFHALGARASSYMEQGSFRWNGPRQNCKCSNAPGVEQLRPRQAALALRALGARLRARPVSYTHLTLPTICSV
eukprot:14714189-Alexandrium_andersonii.AAC.1